MKSADQTQADRHGRREQLVVPLCLLIAIALHVGLLPVLGGVLSAGAAPGAGRLEVVWAAGPEAASAGGVLPLELRVRDGAGARLDAGVEVRVKWARGPRAEAVDIARWADPQGADADTRAMRWDWNVPAGWSGPGVLLAEARRAGDPDDAWSAAARRAVWIASAGAPAVEVATIEAPDAVAVGGVLEVGFGLVNRGEGWVRDGATDRVELRPAGVAGSEAGATPWTVASVVRDGPLAPGAEVTARPPAVRLPAEVLPGAYELVVTPGGAGGVARSRPIAVRPAATPDLAVASFAAPPTVTAGEPFALRFAIENRSPRATGPGLWGDRVYLSADAVLGPDDVVLKSEPRGRALGGFDAYASPEHAVTLDPADATSSAMFLIVSADDGGDLDEGAFENNNTRARRVTIVRPQDDQAPPPEVTLGRDKEPADRVTVAWIAHDDFQDLQARRSVTHQPAVQARLEPTPDAPLRSDASPGVAGPERAGAVDAASAAAATPPPPALPVVLEPATPEREPRPAGPATLDPAAATPGTAEDPADGAPTEPASPPLAEADPPVEPTPEPEPATEPATERTAEPATEPAVKPATEPTTEPAPASPAVAAAATTPEPTPEPRPTSTPRSDREADPTAPVAVSVVRPGAVRVGPGLEVLTVRPRFSVTARLLSVPRNPEVELTFDPDGRVRTAELRTSTGYKNIDGPLLSSLYAWTATGPQLTEQAEVRVAITILFRAPATPPETRDAEAGSETGPDDTP